MKVGGVFTAQNYISTYMENYFLTFLFGTKKIISAAFSRKSCYFIVTLVVKFNFDCLVRMNLSKDSFSS